MDRHLNNATLSVAQKKRKKRGERGSGQESHNGTFPPLLSRERGRYVSTGVSSSVVILHHNKVPELTLKGEKEKEEDEEFFSNRVTLNWCKCANIIYV